MTHKPATPLPWRVGDAGQTLFGPPVRQGIHHNPPCPLCADPLPKVVRGKTDMQFAAHAANAYPRLVEALRSLCEPAETPTEAKGAALLKELGE